MQSKAVAKRPSPSHSSGSSHGDGAGDTGSAKQQEEEQQPDVLFEIDLETGTGSWETLPVLRGQLPSVVAKDFAKRHNLPEKHVAVLRHVIEKAMEKYDPAPVGRDRRPSGDVRAAAMAAR